MADDAPNPSGSNQPKASEEEIAEWMEVGKTYVAKDIQEVFGLSKSVANRRLNMAAESGLIEKIKKGHRTVLWQKAEDDDGGSDA